jgi:hypothetical protein
MPGKKRKIRVLIVQEKRGVAVSGFNRTQVDLLPGKIIPDPYIPGQCVIPLGLSDRNTERLFPVCAIYATMVPACLLRIGFMHFDENIPCFYQDKKIS